MKNIHSSPSAIVSRLFVRPLYTFKYNALRVTLSLPDNPEKAPPLFLFPRSFLSLIRSGHSTSALIF